MQVQDKRSDRDLLAEIGQLRTMMAPLEPDAHKRKIIGRQALDHVLGYLAQLPDLPTYGPPAVHLAQLTDPGIPEEPRDFSDILDQISQSIDHCGFATASPRFMGYIPGGGLYHSALADMLAAASNKYAGFASASPGAVHLENLVTRWLADVIGYPAEAAGTLTSGGSIANLTAIVAAREARDREGGGAVYLTNLAHHCIDKALNIAGRAQSPRRQVAIDTNQRMSATALAAALKDDIEAGIRPWLVIASAGTIDCGAIDPLAEISALCRESGAWFHVDGAYGGLFALCEEGRARLEGIGLADSIALDPHKTLFLPYGTGAVLLRDGQHLIDAFSVSADYIEPLGEYGVGPSPSEISIELTRHFRALRLWLPLQAAGLRAFRAAQAEKLALARYFYEHISRLGGFEVGPTPDLSVVAFRYLPKGRNADAFNETLLRRLVDKGRVLLSGSRVNGNFVLRCAILSFRTHLEHVNEVLAAIQQEIEAMKSTGRENSLKE